MAIKEQITRLKTKKIEDDFYRWKKEFLEFSECLGIKAYVSGEKQYPSTQEILCDTLADGDVKRGMLMKWYHKYIRMLLVGVFMPYRTQRVFGQIILSVVYMDNLPFKHLSNLNIS